MPDWSGKAAVIVASGPSAADADLAHIRGRAKVIAINESWRLAPWADVLYACDYAWWRHRAGAPEFAGMKIAGDRRAASEPWGVDWINVRRVDAMVFDEPGIVGRIGGASGAQAINLAVNWGARRIALVGFDMRPGRRHWHPDHTGGLNNPTDSLMRIWARALDRVVPALSERGIRVVNCSPVSALTAYPKMGLAEWADVACLEAGSCVPAI